MRKYGLENFQFEIIEYCKKEELDEKEQYWINHYASNEKQNGYNIASGGQKSFGLSGENHSQAKLTQKQVDEIYDLLQNHLDVSIRQIGKMFNITNSMISQINNGKNWKRENQKYPLRPPNYANPGEKNPTVKLNAEVVKEIRRKFQDGVSVKELYQEYQPLFHVSINSIRNVITRKTWKNI